MRQVGSIGGWRNGRLWFGRRLVRIHRQYQGACGQGFFVAFFRLVIGLRGCRIIQQGHYRAADIQRHQIDAAQPDAHLRIARQVICAQHIHDQWRVLARTSPSRMTLASSSVMPFCCTWRSVQKRSMLAW